MLYGCDPRFLFRVSFWQMFVLRKIVEEIPRPLVNVAIKIEFLLTDAGKRC